MRKISTLFPCLLISALSACGGGGSSGTGPVASSANSVTASADQTTFESLALAPNMAYKADCLLPVSGVALTGISYCKATPTSLTASPLRSGVQTATVGADVSISNTLVPGAPGVGRYVVNQMIVADTGALERYSYVGAGVKRELWTADGSTMLASELRSNFQSVPLSGAMAAAPADFRHYFDTLFTNGTLLNPTATFGTGARYVSYTATNTSDVYRVLSVGTGTTATPVATGVGMDGLLNAAGGIRTSDRISYTMADGTITTINGVRTFVATMPRPIVSTVSYRTFYEIGGNVYTGDLIKANAVLGGAIYNTVAGDPSTANRSSQLQLRFNKAAVDSLHAAATF